MNKAQKVVLGFIAAALVFLAVLLAAYFAAKTPDVPIDYPNSAVLYYGESCPHCKIVEEFMKNNSVETRMNITQKEAFSNSTNAQELIKIGSSCKLPKIYIGAVPLLYSDGKCYTGDKDIIAYFKTKLGLP